MKMDKFIARTVVFVLGGGLALAAAETAWSRSPDSCEPVVVAHRGASGYVPEHTLGAYALAITMGADYIEPDLVMTKDRQLIARHENEISITTDVAQRPEFAQWYRTQNIDGRQVTGWFTEDFTLAELKTLRAIESLPNVRPGNARMDGSFEIPTMQEIIDLAKSFETSERRIIGLYPEIKHPTHFQQIGLGMERPLADLFHDNGYRGSEAPVYIQSFEVNNLKELRNMTDLRLLQLISGSALGRPYDQVVQGTNFTYGDMLTAEGLREVATYAAAVGPDKRHIIPRTADNRLGTPTNFVQFAHAAGLKVHPYTFRAENIYLPVEFRSDNNSISSFGNSKGEMSAFLATGIDGLFTDQADILARLREPCYTNVSNSETRNAMSILLLLNLLHLLFILF